MQLLFVILFSFVLHTESLVKVFPETCTELLPEYDDYIQYLEDLGALWSYSSRFYAKEVFKLLAIRDLYQKNNLDIDNPINNDIRQVLCKCRLKIKDKLVTASSYEMKICLKKQLGSTIKRAITRYKSLLAKRSVLIKVEKDKRKYRNLIKYLKRSAQEEVSSMF